MEIFMPWQEVVGFEYQLRQTLDLLTWQNDDRSLMRTGNTRFPISLRMTLSWDDFSGSGGSARGMILNQGRGMIPVRLPQVCHISAIVLTNCGFLAATSCISVRSFSILKSSQLPRLI